MKGYNFCFLSILGNWSCDHPSQQHFRWTLTNFIIPMLVAPSFWPSPMIFSVLGRFSEPWEQYLTFYIPFLLISNYILYSGHFNQNEISNESTRHPYEIAMRISRHLYEVTMKYHRHKNEIPNEISYASVWNRNEIS